MAEILQLEPNYGIQVSYEYNNQVSPFYTGDDYVNAQWLQPLASYIFGLAWFDQSVYDYIATFFNQVKGSEQTFLFTDLFDYRATNIPTMTLYSTETQGVLVQSGSQFQLAKKYSLNHGGGTVFVTKAITRPKASTVTIYDDLGSPTLIQVDPGTGILITGGGVDYTWEGEYYTPVRILNDKIPQEIISYDKETNQQLYSLPDLRLIEVREDTAFPQTYNLDFALDHVYALGFEYRNAIDRTSRADVFTASSGYESRDDIDVNRRYITLSESLLEEDKKDYLLTLWRVCLGTVGGFKFQDLEANIDVNCRFLNPVSFLLFSSLPSDNYSIYQCSGLELTEEITPRKTPYCHLWKVTKRDSTIVGFTDHDERINYLGVDYLPNFGFSGGANSNTSQLNADSAELDSVFTPLGFTEADVLAGRLDDASIEHDFFNWATQIAIKRLFTGNIGSYAIGHLESKAKRYRLEALSLADKLGTNARIETTSTCAVKFLSQGVRQCNRTIDASVRESATVVSASNTDIVVSGIADASVYRRGTCRFTSGQLSSLQEFFIGDADATTVKLLYGTPLVAVNGDTVELTRFCDKTVDGAQGCQVYANTLNFVGYPETPTADLNITKAEGQ